MNLKLNRVDHTQLVGQVESHSEAKDLMRKPGELVLVFRGRPRSLVMLCPCGCNEQVTLNLDSRAGPAWYMYRRQAKITLYPSVWRESGCKSHFVIWNDKIYWFDYDSYWDEEVPNPTLEAQILEQLKGMGFIHYRDLAELLDEIPWTLLNSCRHLERKGIICERPGTDRGYFRYDGNS